jgi:predicted nuclease of predicted toxin-antitoxin system
MSLSLLADQCVPSEIIEFLTRAGHHVTRVRDVMPIRSPDVAVITKARELQAILISLNGDFSDIVSYPPAQYQGIFAVQLHNHPEIIPRLMERLCDYLARYPDQEFYVGKLFIIEAHRIRVRI